MVSPQHHAVKLTHYRNALSSRTRVGATLVFSAEEQAAMDLFDLLFACRHRRTTFPLTPARKKSAGGQSEKPGDTYVVCLECGKQFLYDWENMRLGKAV